MSDYFPTKYDSARDEVISLLSDEAEGYGMRDDTSGDVESPTGHFALVTIPADVTFTGEDGLADEVANTYGVTADEVTGVHIVTTDSQGFVYVVTFETEAEARAEFERLSEAYGEWLGDDDDA